MKITKDQWEKIKEINDTIKDLDPILKEKVIDIELANLFKEEYFKFYSIIKGETREKETEPKEKITTKHNKETQPLMSTASKTRLKDFYNEKKPSSEQETVTVFGFYLEHSMNMLEFSESDISRCYFDARVRKPKNIGQVLRDAKNKKGYLVEGNKSGKFRLSNVGENLVIHDLPRKV